MSYDFLLFNLPYPQQSLEYNLEVFGWERDASPLNDQEWTNLETLIAQISYVTPKIKVFRHKTGAVINLAQEPDSQSGTQIELESREAIVSIPYWYSGETALNVFEEIWQHLHLLQSATGYLIYDNQLDKTLNLDSDFQEVYERYTFLAQLRTAK